MKAVCPHCETSYEFDAAAIPPEGYNAQCTQCQQVFFVSNDTENMTASIDKDKLSVSCPACNTFFTFEKSAIPENGYDAQCTNCQVMFKVPSAEAILAGELAVLIQTDNSGEQVQESSQGDNSKEENESMHSLASETPAVAPETPDVDTNEEEDFAANIAKKKKIRKIVGLSVAGLMVLMAGMYLVTPTVFDAVIGKHIGIKAGINPDAIPYFEKGYALFIQDEKQAYEQANNEFEKALKEDPQYPHAVAFASLSYNFLAQKIRLEGQKYFDQGEAIIKQIEELDSKQSKRRIKKYKQKREELRKQANELSKQATEIFTQAGKIESQGFSLLKKNQKQMQTNVTFLQGYGIFHTNDEDKLAKAKHALKNTLIMSRIDPKQPLDLEADIEPWTLVLYGLVKKLESKRAKDISQEAIKALVRADQIHQQKHQKPLLRVQAEVADIYLRNGNTKKAQELIASILKVAPNHREALFMKEKIEVPQPQQEAEQAKKLKKKKKKRNRG